MREAMPVEPIYPLSPATPSWGPLVQPRARLGPSCGETDEYISVGVSPFDQMVTDDQHAAAIEMAISVAQLPKGTAIILHKHHRVRTDILVCSPSQADYSVLASVDGDEIVLAGDFVTPVAESAA